MYKLCRYNNVDIKKRDALYTRKKTMDIRIKDRPLGGDAITF